MNKLSVFTAFVFLMFSASSKAIEPISISMAAAVALPMAKIAASSLLGATEAKGCKPQCYQGGSYCKSGLRYRNYRECKGACQRIIKQGDYQLRVRFVKDEHGNVNSLLQCAQVGAKASGRDELGKEKKSRPVPLERSIAIYSPDDLDIALFYILKHKFLKIFTISSVDFMLAEYKQQISDLKSSTESPEEFLKRVKADAQVQMVNLENQIEGLRKNGLFGPQ